MNNIYFIKISLIFWFSHLRKTVQSCPRLTMIPQPIGKQICKITVHLALSNIREIMQWGSCKILDCCCGASSHSCSCQPSRRGFLTPPVKGKGGLDKRGGLCSVQCAKQLTFVLAVVYSL